MSDAAAAPPTARLSAEARHALLREDTAIIGKPFNVRANPRAIQANTRHMALLLRASDQPDRASRAAAFAESLLDTLNDADVKEPIACAKGCVHCCTTYVSATVPEILNVARNVRLNAARTARTFNAAGRAAQIPQNQREARRILCPMIEQHMCGAYVERPLACRALLSTSLETCMKIFVEDMALRIPHAGNSALNRSVVVLMLKAALMLAGLPHKHYELTQAMMVALMDPRAEERWLAGEPIFAGVPTDTAESSPSPLTGMANVLIEAVRPTL
jgi:hypothetical protein